MAAPAIFRALSAAIRSASTTIGPRDVFTSRAVGFMSANSGAPTRPRVRSLRPTWMETTSARLNNSSLETNVDLDHCKIFIDRGKGNKDRYILFPESFRLVLKSHLKANPKNHYLFESRRFGAFSPRRVQQIVYQYRQRAGIAQPVHPHLFRHQMLTYLTSQGLSDAQIQLISGHKTKKSLEVYQHLSLQAVESAYQEAVHSLNI